MRNLTPEQYAANTLAAASHVLVGEAGRYEEASRQTNIIYGPPVDMLNLLNWTNWVREEGRQIIHLSFPDPNIPIPTLALVFVDDQDRATVIESCLLWMPQSGDRAWIIPDGDGWGAYRLDNNLQLKHHTRPPVVRNSKAAMDGYGRAYTRMLEIAREQIKQGAQIALPTRMRVQAS